MVCDDTGGFGVWWQSRRNLRIGVGGNPKTPVAMRTMLVKSAALTLGVSHLMPTHPVPLHLNSFHITRTQIVSLHSQT